MKKLLSFAAVLLMIFAGCQKENTLVNPTLEKSGWEAAAQRQGLQFIAMPADAEKSLNKMVLTSTKFVEANTGAKLMVDNHYKSISGQPVNITAELTVPAHALDSDAYITMNFTDENLMTNVDLTFGPSPLSLNIPALLDVNASGLDLSGLSSGDQIKLMYYNEKTKKWEEMKAKEISFNIEKGQIRCIDGELPHFSRYGFTR